MKRISCEERDVLFASAESPVVSSSLTNFVAGEIIDTRFPPHTATTWSTADGQDFLRDVLDADGCRHWSIEPDGIEAAS